ncbi:MAG: sugar ABC transporter permease [Alkalispirochaeta sp.]
MKITHALSEKLNAKTKDRIFGLLLMVPAVAFVSILIFLPVAQSVGMSFTDYTLSRGQGTPDWNSFENYTYLAESGALWNSLRVTAVFVVGVVTALVVMAIIIAVALNQALPGRRLLRSVALLPWVTPTVIGALLWMWILQPQYGVMNYMLTTVGLIEEPISWLANVDWALPSVMAAAFWRQFPFMFVVVLAGLQGIPREMYESAMIDGASFLRRFFSITLPLLRNVIRVVILMSVIMNFRQFPLVWTMTGGGPIDRTMTLAVLSYRQSFVNLNFGRGAAVATIWLLVVLVFSIVFTKLFKAREYE